MNWTTIVWPMVMATCLTLALIHLRVGCGDGPRAPQLFFSLAALAVAVISALDLRHGFAENQASNDQTGQHGMQT